MKKLPLILATVLGIGAIAGGTAAANAAVQQPARPAWILADGRTDYTKMPDTAEVPYQCWNGKTVNLTGKTVKQQALSTAMPGSADHARDMAKSRELAHIPGVVTEDGKGTITYHIDDTNPAIQKVMKKYEAMEYPQCL